MLGPTWVFVVPFAGTGPRRARLPQVVDAMRVGAQAAELSHLAAVGPRASHLLVFQLCSSPSHCRATVPPIGRITAAPHAYSHAGCVRRYASGVTRQDLVGLRLVSA